MQIEEILYHQTLFSNSGTKRHLTSWCPSKKIEQMVLWCHFHMKCPSIKQLSCFISSGTKGRKQTLSRTLTATQILPLLVLDVKRPTRLLPVRCRWIGYIWLVDIMESRYVIHLIFRQHFRLKHRESSSPTKNHLCDQCDKVYNSSGSLKQHIRKKHLKKDVGRVPGYYPCPSCGKVYSYIAVLWQHTKNVHGNKSWTMFTETNLESIYVNRITKLSWKTLQGKYSK